jgi:Flp pilus assembly protein TadD
MLAEAYCMTEQFEKCLVTAQKVIKLKPDSAEGYNALGAAYVSLDHWDEGIAAVKKALELNPGLKTAQANLVSWKSHVPPDAQ